MCTVQKCTFRWYFVQCSEYCATYETGYRNISIFNAIASFMFGSGNVCSRFSSVSCIHIHSTGYFILFDFSLYSECNFRVISKYDSIIANRFWPKSSNLHLNIISLGIFHNLGSNSFAVDLSHLWIIVNQGVDQTDEELI